MTMTSAGINGEIEGLYLYTMGTQQPLHTGTESFHHCVGLKVNSLLEFHS